MAGRNSIVVLGGNGFVGSAVCEEAVKRGLKVTSISRRGTAPAHLLAKSTNGSWHQQVTWAKGDLFDKDGAWASNLDAASAVISCVGGFGSVAAMEAINGDVNVALVKTAAAHQVPRFVYISASHFKLPQFLKQGYYAGKFKAEAAVSSHYSSKAAGAILRPGAVYGTRYVETTALPLWLLFKPLEVLTRSSIVTAVRESALGSYANVILSPPVSVQAVANAAVDAATDSSVNGVLEDKDIYARAQKQ